jgi:hypothetical protein
MHNIQRVEHRSFFFAIILVALGSLNTAKDITKDAPQLPLDYSNQILSSTVQMRIYEPGGTFFSYGLGSLFVYQGIEYVLTHSHWSGLLPGSKVQFRDRQNSILGEITGQEFMDMILYQDAGSIIAATPRNFCCPAPLTKINFELSQNDQVAVVHYDSPGHSNIKISPAQILQASGDDIPVYAITMLDGDQSETGDSGAGIWYEGKLVATLWSIILKNPPVEWKSFQVIFVARFPDEFYKLPSQGINPFYLPEQMR